MLRAKFLKPVAGAFAAGLFVLNFAQGALLWETRQIQLSANSEDKQAIGVFRFTNDGDKPLTITSVKPSCGCTTAEIDQRTFAPKESGAIKATFAFEGRTGLQEKIIAVTTDESPDQPVSLVLRVTIHEPLACSSRLLLWKASDGLGEKTVIVSPADGRKIASIEAVAEAPSAMSVKIRPAEGDNYQLIVRPATASKTINVAIACVATFSDGTSYSFKIFGLVR